MVSNCANTNCNATFRFVQAGRVFRFDFPVEGESDHQDILWDAEGSPRKTELFWLCDDCAKRYTLVKTGAGQIKLEPLSKVAAGV